MSLKVPDVQRRKEDERHAYVITLWGASPSYVLGALALGESIRKVGSEKDLVVLYTSDVVGIHFLRQMGWKTVHVEHIDSHTRLFSDPNRGRFSHVFTKLHALKLTQYTKICMLDIDMLVLQNIDDVFDLPAPAAMRRGQTQTGFTYENGQKIDGQDFFFGGDPDGQDQIDGWQVWGQATGINAGIMLLEPKTEVYENMIQEVRDGNHPSHIPGNGPEQDYLSRYYADKWHHISVEYNFQLHQLYYALHPKDAVNSLRATLCRKGLDNLKVIHYSGDKGFKPWDYVTQLEMEKEPMQLEEFIQSVLEGFQGYMLWSEKDKETWGYHMEMEHFSIDNLYFEDGEVYWKNGEKAIIPEDLKVAARNIVHGSFTRWAEVFNDVQSKLGINIVAKLHEDVSVAQELKSTISSDLGSRIEKAKTIWKYYYAWWGILADDQKENTGRVIVSADSLGLKMILPGADVRLETVAPFLVAALPHDPVPLHTCEALDEFLKTLKDGTYIVLTMSRPPREAFEVLARNGISAAAFPEEQDVPQGYFLGLGNKGEKTWTLSFDSHAACLMEEITMPVTGALGA